LISKSRTWRRPGQIRWTAEDVIRPKPESERHKETRQTRILAEERHKTASLTNPRIETRTASTLLAIPLLPGHRMRGTRASGACIPPEEERICEKQLWLQKRTPFQLSLFLSLGVVPILVMMIIMMLCWCWCRSHDSVAIGANGPQIRRTALSSTLNDQDEAP
jgi:hypothetical protein